MSEQGMSTVAARLRCFAQTKEREMKRSEFTSALSHLPESYRSKVADIILEIFGWCEASAGNGKYSTGFPLALERTGPEPWFFMAIRKGLELEGFRGIAVHPSPDRTYTIQVSW